MCACVRVFACRWPVYTDYPMFAYLNGRYEGAFSAMIWDPKMT